MAPAWIHELQQADGNGEASPGKASRLCEPPRLLEYPWSSFGGASGRAAAPTRLVAGGPFARGAMPNSIAGAKAMNSRKTSPDNSLINIKGAK